MRTGSDVLTVRTGRIEKIARILRMHSNKRERIQETLAGDIVAVIGLKTATTGDTITDAEHPIRLEAIEIYEPVINVAVEPRASADQEKVALALNQTGGRGPPPFATGSTRIPARP